ncbi:MAG TPA: acyl-CoA dehydrogenase family protein, partial [Catenuloplanes sp.]
AAVTIARDAPTAARDTSAAKVACADAAHRAARAALQVHGAIGYTAEYGLGRWLTKIRALLPAWGTQSEHRARVMAALLAQGGRTWT